MNIQDIQKGRRKNTKHSKKQHRKCYYWINQRQENINEVIKEGYSTLREATIFKCVLKTIIFSAKSGILRDEQSIHPTRKAVKTEKDRRLLSYQRRMMREAKTDRPEASRSIAWQRKRLRVKTKDKSSYKSNYNSSQVTSEVTSQINTQVKSQVQSQVELQVQSQVKSKWIHPSGNLSTHPSIHSVIHPGGRTDQPIEIEMDEFRKKVGSGSKYITK